MDKKSSSSNFFFKLEFSKIECRSIGGTRGRYLGATKLFSVHKLNLSINGWLVEKGVKYRVNRTAQSTFSQLSSKRRLFTAVHINSQRQKVRSFKMQGLIEWYLIRKTYRYKKKPRESKKHLQSNPTPIWGGFNCTFPSWLSVPV